MTAALERFGVFFTDRGIHQNGGYVFCSRAAPSNCFARLFITILIGTALLINAVSLLMIRKIVQIICIMRVKQTMKKEVSKLEGR